MGSRDRDTKSLQDKLKVFFKKAGVPAAARGELALTAELERELSPETAPPRRVRAARDLADRLHNLHLHHGGAERVWCCVRDLLAPAPEAGGGGGACGSAEWREARLAALGLLRALCEGQADRLERTAMRTVLFRWLQESLECAEECEGGGGGGEGWRAEEESARVRLVGALTAGGRDVAGFEMEAGALLARWCGGGGGSPRTRRALTRMLTNLVKYNASSLDDHVVHAIVDCACGILESSASAGDSAEGGGGGGEAGSGGGEDEAGADGAEGEAALALLEAVVSYALLPVAALGALVRALARAVSRHPHTQPAWKLARALLGADIGHAALLHLVRLARGDSPDSTGSADPLAARGAVFFIYMALWGGPRDRVPSLRVSHLAVLPALLKAVELGQPAVTFEVVSALGALVGRSAHAHELCEPAWDGVLRVLDAALQAERALRNALTHARLHALITTLEGIAEGTEWAPTLLRIVEAVGSERDERSALWAVDARGAALRVAPPADPAPALQLADRYLRRDARPAVRLRALHHLQAYVMRNKVVYGEEVVERVGVPVAALCCGVGVGAGTVEGDAAGTGALRAAGVRLAVQLARAAHGDVVADLLDLLEKVLDRPLESAGEGGGGGGGCGPEEAEAAEAARLACSGLVELVHALLPRAPGAHAARAALVLLDHLHRHYRRPHALLHHPDIRLQIFEMIFGLRANAFNCVGFCYDESGAPVWGEAAARLKPLCSPYLVVEGGTGAGQGSAVGGGGVAVLPGGRAARALVVALTREADWAVLSAVLRALPHLLQARALAVTRRPQELDLLASTLCAMVSDRSLSLPAGVGVGGGGAAGAGAGGVSLSAYQAAVLAPLAALAPYHALLEPQTQQRIVRCLLKHGMVLRAPAPYLGALTVFALETRDTMVKMLPQVLLDLSKISDTHAIAAPMLEFLSTLTRLPRVFASFVEDQYMSVFAILLPYTNPQRYNQYVVSLAHRVIAAWFLQCRLAYRRNFVRFIIHGLHNYSILPVEERLARVQAAPPGPAGAGAANEDSSNRQRSSSLGSRAVSRAPGPAPLGRGGAGGGGGAAADSAAFHVELTETCVDLLSRYAFTPCSVKPAKSDVGEFIFSGGQSMTWLVGHKLVTITTSGCTQNPIKQGLCERCATLCRQHAERAASPLPAASAPATAPAPAQPNAQQAVPAEGTTAAPAGATPAAAPALADVKRQNSGESEGQALSAWAARLERLEAERGGGGGAEGGEETAGGYRAGELAAGGGCPCWCAQWARVHVRAPTGDTAWVARLQNHTQPAHDPFEDVAALLAPVPTAAPAPPMPAPPAPAPLHKSSSEGGVSEERHAPHAASLPPQPQPPRMSTQPINIPGSPQRQSSSSTTDDDDVLLIAPPGKTRHPVRRSNSSPEMSSWKLSARDELAEGASAGGGERILQLQPDDMIVLPAEARVEAPAPDAPPHKKGGGKKAAGDMRVSCEAIPEEMSGTSPLAAHPTAPTATPAPPAHPHLMTFNSDPGSRSETEEPGGGAAGGAGTGTTHHQLQKTASDSTVSTERGAGAGGGAGAISASALRDDLPPLARSKRSNTISVMSPTRRYRENTRSGGGAQVSSGGGGGSAGTGTSAGGGGCGGLSPAFVFLQLYHNMSTYPLSGGAGGGGGAAGAGSSGSLHPLAERPLKLAGAAHERTIKNLDLMPPLETYKIGVLYVGPGQHDDEVAILANEYGSVRYAEFLSGLGELVPLGGSGGGGDIEAELFMSLEAGADGRYTYVWRDCNAQAQFHVATAMPRRPHDPSANEKRKYIGNDLVSIVYNDSGHDFNILTIKGQFNLCIVVVEPLEAGLTRISVKSKDERVRTFLPHVAAHVVTDPNAALLARQTALHCTLAAQVSQSLKLGGAPYASNALERLRLIKRLRRRAEAERLAHAARAPAPYARPTPTTHRVAIDDFNDYT